MAGRLGWSVASVVVLVCAAVASAQTPETTISSTGMVTLKKPPEVLRMMIEVTAEGKTFKEAVSKIAARRVELKRKLMELGAVEGSIELGEARSGGAMADQRRQMEYMVRSRVSGKKPAPAAAMAKASMMVKAEWALKAKDGDDMAVLCNDLQEKIRAADLGGIKNASLAEQEGREEAEASPSMGGEEAQRPGEPAFLFVARISEEERAKALADAFTKARENAAMLAKASGLTLGVVRSVTSQAGQDYSDGNYGRGYGAYYMMQMQQREGGNDMSEAIGQNTGAVQMRVMVSTSFAAK